MPLPSLLQDRLSLPVIGSPMFIVSMPELVIAQCKAGIVGSFPALNARPKELLEDWIVRIKTELAAPAAPTRRAGRAVRRQPDRARVQRSAGARHRRVREAPGADHDHQPARARGRGEAAHSYGGLVFHDVINVRHAQKAVEAGVDGLILVCAGAGGHAGTLSPFALVGEVRSWFKGTVVLAGAIANGSAVLAAQAMGADLAYVGTRFIATARPTRKPEYKRMIVEASAGDIVYSSLFTGVLGNYLKRSVAAAGLDPDNLPSGDKSKMNFGSSSKAWRDVWSAGQGVGTITDIHSVADCVARLREEYAAAATALMRTEHWRA